MARPGNSRHSTTPKPSTPRPFAIRFHNGRWQIRRQSNWFTAREISLLTPAILTPTGEICGMGVVSQHGTVFSVTS